MRLNNIHDIEHFIAAINACERAVWLTDNHGENLNLKSAISMYKGIADLLGNDASRYEMFCDSKADEMKMIGFFTAHPELVA